jgi:hypothetical protein
VVAGRRRSSESKGCRHEILPFVVTRRILRREEGFKSA